MLPLSLVAWLAATSALSPVLPRTRAVTLADFRFVGLPVAQAALPEGTETWSVTNKGRALHELQVRRLRDSTELTRALAWLDAGSPALGTPGTLLPVTDVLLPGEQATRTITLRSGLYLVYCLVPSGQRTATHEIEQHFMLGMRATFVVAPASRDE